MPDGAEQFTLDVCRHFGLGDKTADMVPMGGSTNRLWDLQTRAGRYVVKELASEGTDGDTLAGWQRATDFERAIGDTGRLRTAEPFVSRDSRVVIALRGSRDRPVAVRVHHWLPGTPVGPVTPGLAREAGRALAAIQEQGAAFETGPPQSLRWWPGDPLDVCARLARNGELPPDLHAVGITTIERALEVVVAAESISGRSVFSHLDHKPDNSMLLDGGLAVLDWDECGLCHPRVEAAESALRWALGTGGELDPDLFMHFLAGYREAGASIDDLEAADFGKYVAALVGWFTFMGRRALHDFADTDREAATAGGRARDTLRLLARSLTSLERWAASDTSS